MSPNAFVICITIRSTPWLGAAEVLRTAEAMVVAWRRARLVPFRYFLADEFNVSVEDVTLLCWAATATAWCADTLFDRRRHPAARLVKDEWTTQAPHRRHRAATREAAPRS